MSAHTLATTPATVPNPIPITMNSPPSRGEDPQTLLRQFQPRKQPSKSFEERREPQIAIYSAVVSLLSDDEDMRPASPRRPIKQHPASRYPPSSMVLAQSQPYTLPPGSISCPFSSCPRHNKDYSKKNMRRLLKHMHKRHNWPKSILQTCDATQGSHSSVANPQVRTSTPPLLQTQQTASLPLSTRDATLTFPVSSAPTIAISNAHRTPEGVLEPTLANASSWKPPGPHARDDADIKTDLFPGIPLDGAPAISRKRLHDGHVKCSPSTESMISQAVPIRPATSGYGAMEHCEATTGSEYTLGHLKATIPVADASVAHPSTAHADTTKRLEAAIPLSVKSAGKSRPWTPDEEALLLHLKDKVRLRWIEVEPYFSYRGNWHLAQSRYSKLTRMRKMDDQSTYHVQEPAVASPSPLPDPSTHQPVLRDLESKTARRSGRNVQQQGAYSAYFTLAPLPDESLPDNNVREEEDDAQTDEDYTSDQRSDYHGEERSQNIESKLGIAQLIRQREVNGVNTKNISTSHLLGPYRQFKGTSSDVNCVAWAPNGSYFAVGSTALTDEASMQYNRPNNLLFGDVDRHQLLELPNHVTKRRSRTAALQMTQDRLLFHSISSVQFSSDSRVLFSAGYDRHIKLWEVGPYSRRKRVDIDNDSISSHGFECKWDFTKMGDVDLIAVAPCLPQGTGLFASAIKTAGPHKEPIKVYNYSLDSSDDITTVTEAGILGPSKTSSADISGRRQLDPSCLRFCPTPSISNRYLLGGFTARDDAERRGEACIWDVEKSVLLASLCKRAVFDMQWSPSVFGRFAVGCSAHGVHGVNRGTQSVVRIHDSRWISTELSVGAYAKIELECPAFDINDVVFNPRDDRLVAAGCTDGVTYVWDLRNASQTLHRLRHRPAVHELDPSRPSEETDTGVRFLSWDQAGRELISGSSDGIVAAWDPHTGPEDAFRHTIVRMNSGIMAGAFSPDYSNLLLGDVEGSILNLTTGNADIPLTHCEEYEFVADERTKERLRADLCEQSSAHTECASGPEIGHQLLVSGQMELRPFGTFPRRQAVQGSNYTGPYSGAPNADQLRLKAAIFQQEARAKLSASGGYQSKPVHTEAFADTALTDEEHWKNRIPGLRYEPRLQQINEVTPESNASCSMCFGRDLHTAQDTGQRRRAKRAMEESHTCARCSATWRCDVLGYELVYEGRSRSSNSAVARRDITGPNPTPGPMMHPSSGSRSVERSSPDEDDATAHRNDSWPTVETEAYYHGLWEIGRLPAQRP